MSEHQGTLRGGPVSQPSAQGSPPSARAKEGASDAGSCLRRSIDLKARVVVCSEREVLLEERVGPTGRPCLRPIGGHVEFGESGAAAALREFCEETGLHLTGVRFLGCVEDIGSGPRGAWHEVCLLYLGHIAEKAAYRAHSLVVSEDESRHFRAHWVPVAALRSDVELGRWAAGRMPGELPDIRPEGLFQWVDIGLEGEPNRGT